VPPLSWVGVLAGTVYGFVFGFGFAAGQWLFKHIVKD
jgi:hypothetical protein